MLWKLRDQETRGVWVCHCWKGPPGDAESVAQSGKDLFISWMKKLRLREEKWLAWVIRPERRFFFSFFFLMLAVIIHGVLTISYPYSSRCLNSGLYVLVSGPRTTAGLYWPHLVMGQSLLFQKVRLYLMIFLGVRYFDQDCVLNALFLNTLISIRITPIFMSFHWEGISWSKLHLALIISLQDT